METTINLFELATRKKYRFQTSKGFLSVEELWDLSLTSLDAIARAINKELKATAEESFISTNPTGSRELAYKLELLKHIIGVKMDEQAAAKTRAERRAQLDALKEALARKKDEELGGKSSEELSKMIAQLEAEG